MYIDNLEFALKTQLFSYYIAKVVILIKIFQRVLNTIISRIIGKSEEMSIIS